MMWLYHSALVETESFIVFNAGGLFYQSATTDFTGAQEA
jgi:hypothetical protein